MLPRSEKGSSSVVFMTVVTILSALIVAGAFYIKSNPALMNRISPPIETPTQPSLEPSPSTIVTLENFNTSIIAAQNSFGFKMLQALYKTDPGKNIFISPTSITYALSMVYNGAKGTTKEGMAKALEVSDININDLNQGYFDLMNSLKNPDPKIEFSIANSIWEKQGVEFNPEFIQTNKKFFQAQISTLDFSKLQAADTINSWVKEQTKGKIPTIVEPPIPKEMVMYLINAVYFKGSWSQEFDKKLTQDREFTTSSGSKKKVAMMQQKQSLPYLETDQFQATALPYGKDKRLSMYVFLPKENLNTFITGINQTTWDEWMKQFAVNEGTVILPKFKMEYKKELQKTLGDLGMKEAFSGTADLSGIAPNTAISFVLHKTYVDVNEEGTEAAAVTSIGLKATAIVASKDFNMEVNKPFFFVIRDNKSGAIFFAGTIQNPQSN